MLKYILGVFFLIAGFNHFWNPGFYYPLIPDYLPFPVLINTGSGIVEIILGMGILWERFSTTAAWGIVLLLIFFIPSHVYFIQIGSCVEDGLCVPKWVAWIRLLVIHPILIYWAYILTKNNKYGK
ncbi:hypothetical protein MMU07_06580 [Aquiflexum sp. LQ15W]|nr:hypothetical protein [Cognataquiflexum nitidum]